MASGKFTRTASTAKDAKDKDAALNVALTQIEREFGAGSLMKLGSDSVINVEAIPTGALSLDLALGIGGVPRGRIVEIFGPESSGKTTLIYHIIAQAQARGGICAFIDAEHSMDPLYAGRIGVDCDELLVSQPDYGEQALEIVDVLVRSGAVDLVAVDSVAALTPQGRARGPDGRHPGRPAGTAHVAGAAQARRQPEPVEDRLPVHEPDPREDRGQLRQPGDAARWPRAQVLLLAAPGPAPDRDPQGGDRGRRQPGSREGRQEQGRSTVQAGRVRRRVRRGHLQRGLPARPRGRQRHRHEVGLVLLLRGDAPGSGTQQLEAVPRREQEDRRRDRDQDLHRAGHEAGSRQRGRGSLA